MAKLVLVEWGVFLVAFGGFFVVVCFVVGCWVFLFVFFCCLFGLVFF